MKTQNTSTVSKLINRFDNELRNLLMEDLKAVKEAKNQLIDKIKQGVAGSQLAA